jgi:hypothetical protein
MILWPALKVGFLSGMTVSCESFRIFLRKSFRLGLHLKQPQSFLQDPFLYFLITTKVICFCKRITDRRVET